MIMVIKMLKARVTVMLLIGISQPRRTSTLCHLLVALMCLDKRSRYIPGWTRLRNGLNGNPPSRAKDHSWREVVVTWLMMPNMSKTNTRAVMTEAAGMLCVAL
jgi:hypothetical protein